MLTFLLYETPLTSRIIPARRRILWRNYSYPKLVPIHLIQYNWTRQQAISELKENSLWCILDSHTAIVAQEHGSPIPWTITHRKLDLDLMKIDEVMRVRRMDGVLSLR